MTSYRIPMPAVVHGVNLDELTDRLRKVGLTVYRQEAGLSADNGGSNVTVEVSPPPSGSTDIQAVVNVKTAINPKLHHLFDRADLLVAANGFAALGALAKDDEGYCVESRLTIFRDDNAWNIHLHLLVAAVQCSADAVLQGLRNALSGQPAAKGLRSQWTPADLAQVKQWLDGISFCNADGLGLTAEFGLAPGAVSAGQGHTTALWQMRIDQPHPALGGGLFCVLTLPQTFDDPKQLQTALWVLNEMELVEGPGVPHFGAWCASHNGKHPAYVSFLPNFLHAVPGIAVNFAIWASHRASAAYEAIERVSRPKMHISPRVPKPSRQVELVALVRREVGPGLSDDKMLSMGQYLIQELAPKQRKHTARELETIIQAVRRNHPSVLFSELERVVGALQKSSFI